MGLPSALPFCGMPANSASVAAMPAAGEPLVGGFVDLLEPPLEEMTIATMTTIAAPPRMAPELPQAAVAPRLEGVGLLAGLALRARRVPALLLGLGGRRHGRSAFQTAVKGN